MDKHRDICLNLVFSRLLAKVIATRLSDFCEREQVFDEGQWGFRPLRSMIGAIGTVRLLVRLATRPNAPKGSPALVIEPLDMKKAYPNSSRNAYRRVLVCEGIPEKLIEINMGLIELTSRICRNSTGDSGKYTTVRGFKEGCPFSCTSFNMLQNTVLREFRQRAETAGLGHGVMIEWASADSRDEAKIHPTYGLCGKRTKASFSSWHTHHIDLVCFADDTNMVHRENLAADRRKLITDTQQYFGGVVHTGKWQHLRAMREKSRRTKAEEAKAKKRRQTPAENQDDETRNLG